MEERHEIIDFPQDLQLKVFLHRIGNVTRHWHRSLELLFVLEGLAHITTDEKTFLLSAEDVILINTNSIHELYSKDGAVLIALQLKPELFKFGIDDSKTLEFNCNSSVDNNPARYDGLRQAIARMVINNVSKQPGLDYLNFGICYFLLAELVTCFQCEDGGRYHNRQNYTKRLSKILDYIETHYAENFSLSDLAESQQLSVPYLSSFFSQYMGVKFSQYYNDVKLNHAQQDLVNTNHTVERIALDNGFQEVHTFIRAFRGRFGTTPNVYRKTLNQNIIPDPMKSLDYLASEPSNYFHLLQKYLSDGQLIPSLSTSAVNIVKMQRIPTVHVQCPRKHLVHTFKTTTAVGRARDLLNHNIREMLRDLQQTIRYKYIKFHGILSDDMMVCGRAADGSLQFRYQMVNSALEFLLSIGLKPIIQLSFMPTALASDPYKTVFYNPFNTSPPKDMAEWNQFITDFIRHLIAHFGREEIISWPFCVWCEPDTSTKMFGFGDFQLFCEFYKNTYDTVKTVCPDIQFGSPAFLYMRRLGEPVFLTRFIRYALDNNCRPDFMNMHYYSDIIPMEAFDINISGNSSSQLPKETDDFSSFITAVHELFDGFDIGDLPVYLTEWNLTFSHRNLINDTCYKSCYILKNLLENYDRLDSFGYWSLTDLIEENPLPDSHYFHGGLGIYTINGVRKSVFYAFDFANRLGDELLAKGDGYFITRKNGHIQIITYNYVHYGDLFASGDAVGITRTNRYAPFDMSRRVTFSIPLSGLMNGQYTVKEYFVNRDYGSAFDLWVKMGAMPLSREESEVYSHTCVPGYHSEYLECMNSILTYSPTLEPLEIRFAEICPTESI